MKSRSVILIMLALVLAGSGSVMAAAVDVTSQGNPFMTISQSVEDTDYFATGGPNLPYARLTDGDNGTTNDTWEGDGGAIAGWLYDAVGLQFPAGISGVQRFEWDVAIFGDGGWFDSLDAPVLIQVTTDVSFGSVALTPGTSPGDDNRWLTVPGANNYPLEIKSDVSAGAPANGTTFAFEMDYPGTIYGIRVIGNAGGVAGPDATGFIGTQEIRVFTDDSSVRATAVAPTEGATGVEIATAILQWTPAQEGGVIDPNVVGHYVYLGTDPNGVLVSGETALPLAQTSFVPTLAKDTDYYWHVDELLDDGTVLKGYAYSFQTELSLPLIDTQPEDQIVAEGSDAVFTVAATNPLPNTLTYQWYYDADGVTGGEVALTNGADYSGVDSAELMVLAVDAADEGYYYCEISNGNAVSTAYARLTLQILVAHWKFDGDPNDSANGYDGVATGGPVYETGIFDSALVYDGTDDYVTVPAGFDDFTTGLTVSLWAKPTGAPLWARFVDFGNGSATDNILLARQGTTNNLAFEVYGAGVSGGAVFAENALEADIWQMLTATVDVSGNVVLYKNGAQVATGTTMVPAVLERTSNFLGKSNWPDALYSGSMDDVRIYNYALNAIEVADLYVQAPDVDNVCVEQPAYDLDGDCVVGLADFARLATLWMECNLIPASACN